MNMGLIDWAIVAGLLVVLTLVAYNTKKYTKSVADFLVAGRGAGKYLTTIAGTTAAMGAISVVGEFEKYYSAGFTAMWWWLMLTGVLILISASGWVVYRYRQTRVMTMAQFFEIRYSKNFRVYAGFLSWAAGIINFGIFPAVGARFFIYFCGFPQNFPLLGINIPTYPVIMLILLAISLYYCFLGGQVTIMVTDFLQGMFCNIVFVIILFVFLLKFDWTQISQALLEAPKDASLVHPFHTSRGQNFTVWYFLIGIFGSFYSRMSWQGSTNYVASAASAHAAKMGMVLGYFRHAMLVCLIIMPICIYTVLHHSAFTADAGIINSVLETIKSDYVRGQMTVPAALGHVMPAGLLGAFCAIVLAFLISTHDTYLMSWGSILVQDVILPFRKKPIDQKQHIKWIRYSIFGVAAFIFLFSLFYPQNQPILMFFAISGAIYLGGSGAVIIGGLYWKRGTTTAAWTAMMVGSTLAVVSIIIPAFWKNFPLNGQELWFIAMVVSGISYIIVSLVGKKTESNMDKILHRGEYAVKEDHLAEDNTPKPKELRTERKGFLQICLSKLKFNKEFTTGDKIIYVIAIAQVVIFMTTFIFGSIYNITNDVSSESWLKFWQIFTWSFLVMGVIWTIWFAIGGIADLRSLFDSLRVKIRDDKDDGTVEKTDNVEGIKKEQ